MDYDSPTPTRVSVLNEAAHLTGNERNREYGEPAINLGLAGRLKRLVSAHASRSLGPAEEEAISMILTKLARYVTGKPKRDTCVDMAAYAAILWEVSQMAETPETSETPKTPTTDGPGFGGAGEYEIEDDLDEAADWANWVEFIADYGAIDADDTLVVENKPARSIFRQVFNE